MASGVRWRLADKTVRSLTSHLELVRSLVSALPGETVVLARGLGRITSRDHGAAVPSPAFDNSAMDGYAVRAADLAGASPEAPVRLAVIDTARAGHPAAASVGNAHAARIMTGASVPHGADAVVAQEIVERDGDSAVFRAAPSDGAHIRRRGEDAQVGDLVIPSAHHVTARDIAAAAAAGLNELHVVRRPRIGYLVTGDELVAPGRPLGPGQIHDSNGAFLAAALTALGAEPVELMRVGDTPDAVWEALTHATHVDLLITTGGASVGDSDPVKAALSGAGVDFTNVAMQPGKPQGIGRVGDTPVLCFPGNPVAVAVSTELFVVAAMSRMVGVAEPAWQPATALTGWTCPRGREQVMPIVFDVSGVRPATDGGSGSHLAARLGRSEGLARVAADVDEVRAGDTVLVRRYVA